MTSPVYSATNLQGCSVFRALPTETFGAGLDAMFPDMGQGAAQGYALAYREPERFSSHVDLSATLQKIPVALTTLEAWVHKHREAFR